MDGKANRDFKVRRVQRVASESGDCQELLGEPVLPDYPAGRDVKEIAVIPELTVSQV